MSLWSDVKEILKLTRQLRGQNETLVRGQSLLQFSVDIIGTRLDEAHAKLDEILLQLTPAQAARIVLAIQVGDNPEEDDPMAFTMKNTEKATATVARVLDARGQPADVDETSWVWSTTDDTLFKLTPDPLGRSCEIEAVGPLGTARVNVTVDADLGAGVVPITGGADGTVTASQAVQIDVEVGPPGPAVST